MGFLPLDELGATIFFQLISARYERGSIILTSNKSYGEWGSIFPRGTPEKRPMRDTSKPANGIRQDKVVITHDRSLGQ
jgi:DNA replication protein DnaC